MDTSARYPAKTIAENGAFKKGGFPGRLPSFARAARTMSRVDLWHARLALKTLRADQRRDIAEAVEK